ncbi:MAG: 1-acyl-sn-glycerol-3-phosphate acyltransferase [Bacteroidales bacterium]|nr:1-acyl-sn-glycerol-3-phosphate acyltransferase [Bacteroidales bacterium]
MGIERINQKSYSYLFLKRFVAFWHQTVFYRRVVIQNLDRVPQNAHLIFTGNHQNALMDALVFLFGVKSRLVFMARSDLFRNKRLAAILYFFRMLPIFRIRDGYSEVKKNDSIFLKTIEVIKSKIGLVIMAEGNHGDKRKLRPLKKGFARIAFQTEEANNFTLNMQIIPVGIDYSVYENYRTELLINFGNPILVSDYYEAYKLNPAIAINQIKDDLAEKLKPLMVQISSEDYYDLFNELREIYKHEMVDKLGLPSVKQPFKLQCDQTLIEKLSVFEEHHSNEMEAFQQLVLRYRDEVKKARLDYETVQKTRISVLALSLRFVVLLAGLPLFILGWLLNYLPFGIANWTASKMKDVQFHSSVKFVVSLFLYPLLHLLATLLVWIFAKDGRYTLGFYLIMPVLGIFARYYWEFLQRTLKSFSWYRMRKSNSALFQSIQNDQKSIWDQMKKVI